MTIMASAHDGENGTLAQSSGTDEDLLSSVLRYVQLKGDRVFSTSLRGGFSVKLPKISACFHVIREGSALFAIGGQPPFRAEAGDVIFMPRASSHTLSDPICNEHDWVIFDVAAGAIPSLVEVGSGDVIASTISATFEFENANAVAPLLGILPDAVHIRRKDDNSAVLISDVAGFLVLEDVDREPGASLMISRVIDILVIRCIRSWVRNVDARQGWVGSLSDPRLSRVVAAIHKDPLGDWSVANLASIAGMSRSSFAERFQHIVGEPPLRYIQRWRLVMASELLQRSNNPVKDVARSVGYDSEAAFSRAYKAFFGRPPREARTEA